MISGNTVRNYIDNSVECSTAKQTVTGNFFRSVKGCWGTAIAIPPSPSWAGTNIQATIADNVQEGLANFVSTTVIPSNSPVKIDVSIMNNTVRLGNKDAGIAGGGAVYLMRGHRVVVSGNAFDNYQGVGMYADGTEDSDSSLAVEGNVLTSMSTNNGSQVTIYAHGIAGKYFKNITIMDNILSGGWNGQIVIGTNEVPPDGGQIILGNNIYFTYDNGIEARWVRVGNVDIQPGTTTTVGTYVVKDVSPGTVATAYGGLGVDASGWSANLLPYTTGTGAFGSTTITSFGRSLIDDADAATARTTLGVRIGTDVQAYSPNLSSLAGLSTATGNIPYGNGAAWQSLPLGSAGKALVVNGSAPSWGDALQETAEGSNTPVTDTASTSVGASTTRFFEFFTLPTTEKLYVITGIEWKNGATVAGDTICGAVLVDADPPIQSAVPTVAFGQLTSNSGANSIQRVSRIVSQPIRGGTTLGIFVQASSSTHTYRTATVTSANNRKTGITFPSGGNVANQENGAWTANTTKPYIKVYYRGYK